jgi:hydroxyacylglutathione hydrolase
LIHELDESCLRGAGSNLAGWMHAEVEPVSAKRLLKDGDVVEAGSIKLEIIHTPGHTPGGITVKTGSLLFTGDTLFHEGIGRTDIPGGDHELLLKSIKEKLMTLPDSMRVLPGHGPETTIGHERENNPFL